MNIIVDDIAECKVVLCLVVNREEYVYIRSEVAILSVFFGIREILVIRALGKSSTLRGRNFRLSKSYRDLRELLLIEISRLNLGQI